MQGRFDTPSDLSQNSESLASFIKRRNGINEVAARFSKCVSSPENKTVHRISR